MRRIPHPFGSVAGALLLASLGASLCLDSTTPHAAGKAPLAACPKTAADKGGAFAGVTVYDEGDPQASLVPDDSKETPSLRRQFWKLSDYKPPFGAQCSYKGGATIEVKIPDTAKLCELDTRPGAVPDKDIFLRFFCN